MTAQVSANKIIELPFTHLAAPAGTYLIGLALALIETAHHTAPTRREGWKNAQLMIAMGFAGSAVLAIWIAIVNEMNSVGPDRFGWQADDKSHKVYAVQYALLDWTECRHVAWDPYINYHKLRGY